MPTWASRSCDLMAYAEIRSEAELRDLLGRPSGRAVTKERTRLHAVDLEWLAISPFCIVATSDADGNCDASPKGDPAGHLVHVLDDTTVAIAERPGNKRADGYLDRKSTRLNSSHGYISYAVFCLKKKKNRTQCC